MAVDVAGALQRGHEAGKERVRLCVYEFYAGTGNHTEVFPLAMRELVFTNDSDATMTVQILGINGLNVTATIRAGEVLDERFPEFDTVVIVAPTGKGWRFYPRSHLIA